MKTTSNDQVTCISFIQAASLKGKVKGFTMMQSGHKHLLGAKGLLFYKLMGSGRGNGFNPYPDWSTYTLLTVWESLNDAETYVSQSSLYKIFNSYADDVLSIFMKTLVAHGQWSGEQPFISSKEDIGSYPICVITRATIKARYLRKFWSYVPTSSQGLENNSNLLFTKGIGEVPIKQMATFSIWTSMDAMKAFAYNSKQHQQAIKMTKTLNWYSEELFARFRPIKCIGKWQGETLILPLLNP